MLVANQKTRQVVMRCLNMFLNLCQQKKIMKTDIVCGGKEDVIKGIQCNTCMQWIHKLCLLNDICTVLRVKNIITQHAQSKFCNLQCLSLSVCSCTNM